jgi:hypothetical protein
MQRVLSFWMCEVRSHTLAHLPFLIEDEERLLGWLACIKIHSVRLHTEIMVLLL